MTKFIDTTKGSTEKTKTVFTHYLCIHDGWKNESKSPKDFEEVKYLGKCLTDGDMFSCLSCGVVFIYKGTKGSEFD